MGLLTLRWNDFETNISSTYLDLKDDKDFADVTLVSADDQQVEAHKVILAASSPFFKRVLKRNPHQHPLVYLKGVSSAELKEVLNYIYLGAANVPEANLNSFFALAKELELKGLTSGDESTSQQRSSRQSPAQQVNQRPTSPQVVQEPPLLTNNNDGAGGGGDAFGGYGAPAAVHLKKEELDYGNMEEEDYGPSDLGAEEQHAGGDDDDDHRNQDYSQNQEQCSQIFVYHEFIAPQSFSGGGLVFKWKLVTMEHV